jgi:ubiquinone/menaquinone biosynthesis C-methylase UbiE
MSFDRIARHYHWIESCCAGRVLQKCRTAFLDELEAPARVLILGEGDGRFLADLLRRHPQAEVTCVDASATMLQLARARIDPAARVEFIHADILTWTPPAAASDLIVTHFVLDCFRPEELAAVVAKLAAAAAPGSRWLVSDFRVPATGPAKWLARGVLRFLYAFFRRVASVPADHLTPPDDLLRRAGFDLRERRLHRWGLLHSDLWLRPARNQ